MTAIYFYRKANWLVGIRNYILWVFSRLCPLLGQYAWRVIREYPEWIDWMAWRGVWNPFGSSRFHISTAATRTIISAGYFGRGGRCSSPSILWGNWLGRTAAAKSWVRSNPRRRTRYKLFWLWVFRFLPKFNFHLNKKYFRKNRSQNSIAKIISLL